MARTWEYSGEREYGGSSGREITDPEEQRAAICERLEAMVEAMDLMNGRLARLDVLGEGVPVSPPVGTPEGS